MLPKHKQHRHNTQIVRENNRRRTRNTQHAKTNTLQTKSISNVSIFITERPPTNSDKQHERKQFVNNALNTNKNIGCDKCANNEERREPSNQIDYTTRTKTNYLSYFAMSSSRCISPCDVGSHMSVHNREWSDK